MERRAYLAALAADADRITALARRDADADAAVPCCPGWTVRDLLGHLGWLHRRTTLAVAAGQAARSPAPEEPPTAGLVAWFAEGAASLVATLRAHDPDDPAWSWHPSYRTVGFWDRRMAHETLVHRVDVELAHGLPTPVDPRLAGDGVDEILDVMISRVPPGTTVRPGTRSVTVSIPGRAWRLHERRLSGGTRRGAGSREERAGFALDTGAGPTDARVSGAAADMDLWLWGRAPGNALEVTGDRAVVELLRAAAATATA